jgi:hypothetical protein
MPVFCAALCRRRPPRHNLFPALHRFLRPAYGRDMLWSVTWFAGQTGYQCLVCNRCRVAHDFEAECPTGESDAEIRQQAIAKAVELALERRIPLDCVIEATWRYVPAR